MFSIVSVREKQKAEGGSSNTGALWPPLRSAPPPPAAAGDPRQLCASGNILLLDIWCNSHLGEMGYFHLFRYLTRNTSKINKKVGNGIF